MKWLFIYFYFEDLFIYLFIIYSDYQERWLENPIVLAYWRWTVSTPSAKNPLRCIFEVYLEHKEGKCRRRKKCRQMLTPNNPVLKPSQPWLTRKWRYSSHSAHLLPHCIFSNIYSVELFPLSWKFVVSPKERIGFVTGWKCGKYLQGIYSVYFWLSTSVEEGRRVAFGLFFVQHIRLDFPIAFLVI